MQDEQPKFGTSPQTARLLEVLESLELRIKRQNSLKYALVRGMVYGIGTVIGATVLVALFGGLLVSTTDILSGQSEAIYSQTME